MFLILAGMPSSGKTFYLNLLKEHVKGTMLDLDQCLAEVYNHSAKELYQLKGEEGFRQLERDLLLTLSKERGILALGGGTLTYPPNVLLVKNLGKVVYLKRDLTYLHNQLSMTKRLSQGSLDLDQFIHSRLPIYETVADYTILLDKKEPIHILQELIELYGQQ